MSIEVASMSQFGRTEPFGLQVARGQIPNHQSIQILGTTQTLIRRKNQFGPMVAQCPTPQWRPS